MDLFAKGAVNPAGLLDTVRRCGQFASGDQAAVRDPPEDRPLNAKKSLKIGIFLSKMITALVLAITRR